MHGLTQMALATLAVYASAAPTPVPVQKQGSPLSVVLSATNNFEVIIAVTNNGDKPLNLLTKGTFLDEMAPVEKVHVFTAGGDKKIPFEGIRVQLLKSSLSPEHFLPLGVGETKNLSVEAAALHSLHSGGDFNIVAKDTIPIAEANSTKLSSHIPYRSNNLTITLTSPQAATAHKPLLTKRTTIDPSCTGHELTIIQEALSNCQIIASRAATAARSGTKLLPYFKSTDDHTRTKVAERLEAIAKDCGSRSATTTTHCNDPYHACDSSTLAYTISEDNLIAYCPLFFDGLPDYSYDCHGQDQAGTVLHEETHADSVYGPSTWDMAYGPAQVARLSGWEALNNADSYAEYANAVHAC